MNKRFAVLCLVAVVGMGGGLSGCAYTSGQSTLGQYADDATVTARVKKRLAQDPQVSAMRISVETLKGVVELSGFAISGTEKNRAGEIARAVPGVRDVRNHLIVQAPK